MAVIFRSKHFLTFLLVLFIVFSDAGQSVYAHNSLQIVVFFFFWLNSSNCTHISRHGILCFDDSYTYICYVCMSLYLHDKYCTSRYSSMYTKCKCIIHLPLIEKRLATHEKPCPCDSRWEVRKLPTLAWSQHLMTYVVTNLARLTHQIFGLGRLHTLY